MASIDQVAIFFWILNTTLEVLVLFIIFYRKSQQRLPFFTAYVFLVLLQDALVYLIYRHWGYQSLIGFRLAWSLQLTVTCARALSIAEVARLILKRFRGIWGLAWRLLLGGSIVIMFFAAVNAEPTWNSVVLYLDRALELSAAAVVVGLLVFARMYRVPRLPLPHVIAVGFCLYSCFVVVNDSLLNRYLIAYADLWSIFRGAFYFASLGLWLTVIWSERTVTEGERIPPFLPASVYRAVAPEMNARLSALNDSLSRLWKVEANRP
jgi:hypothetical protein